MSYWSEGGYKYPAYLLIDLFVPNDRTYVRLVDRIAKWQKMTSEELLALTECPELIARYAKAKPGQG